MTVHTKETKAGVYGRQSHAKEKSISEQIEAGTADAERQGWTVVSTYNDGVSASRYATKGRDEWARVLADIDAKEIDVIVLWESSRGDRDLETWSAFLALCRKRRVRIRVVKDHATYNLTRPRDWKTLAEDGIDNAYESEKISQRVRRGVTAAALAGKPHGQTTYGYERVYHPITRTLIEQRINLETAPTVQEIFKRVGARDPLTTIADDLNARGVPSPRGGTWDRSTVRKIAMNKAYIGVRVHKGQRVDDETDEVIDFCESTEAIWPMIISEKDFLTAQQVLTDRKRKTTRPGRYRWLLSYLARCGVCGAPLSARPSRKGRAPRYHCGGSGCASVDVTTLDEHVMTELIGMLVKLNLTAAEDPTDATVLAARAEVDRLTIELNGALDSVGRPGGLSWQSAARVEANLRPQIEAAQRRVEQAMAASLPTVLSGAATAEDFRAALDAAPMAARRDVVDRFVSVLLDPAQGRRPITERVRITPLSWPVKLSAPIMADE